DFGYGTLTDIALPGEVRGVVHPPERWDGLTISRMPMGHALSATPLQVHMGMSVLANKGVLMQPQLVRRVFDDEGKTVVDFSPKAKRRVLSSDTARTVSLVLVDTVSARGTSARAQIPGFEVAGKSGTSQKIINGLYSSHDHVASFSGFFPASQPRLVVTVIVDDAQVPGVAWGSSVAAPSFKRVAEQLIQYFGLKPVENYNKMIAWKE
ncbi:MAG TPA: penicillin-binding transpeptidase domain-containing protein, partial [Opitutales bacterium]|nr:penicillin-binding transpeptidase domain-containing protein [Opitutales bacterium]